jgi:succinoglycan biosynthesis protein ExoM
MDQANTVLEHAVACGRGSALPHVCVCICTYRRPDFLRALLGELTRQETNNLFTYSVLVVDNDAAETARPPVLETAASSLLDVKYLVQPIQSIPLTRNQAISSSTGDFIAFIDDDEIPGQGWLLTLFVACEQYKADGVLGPVKPRFNEQPPAWVIRGKFYDRPSYPTGLVINGRQGRTGNVLLKRSIFAGLGQPFRLEFRTGEDQDFFRRMIEKGHRFVWCHEAMAFETVPSIRWNRRFMLRRALHRGATAVLHPTFKAREVVKSLVAVPGYTLVLPVALLCGQHRFMRYLVSLCDHLGKLLALIGVNPVRDAYVTE